MRWKLLRRRLSVAAPRVIVRRHVPWPLRWAGVALVLGFSAAIALWAFELGKGLAGLDGPTPAEAAALQAEVVRLRSELDQVRSIADTAGSLLRAEQTTQKVLVERLRRAEDDAAALRSDLGFFERLIPVQEGQGLTVRSLQVERRSATQVRYQVLVMQHDQAAAEFNGTLSVSLNGSLAGRSWTFPLPDGPRPVKMRQYARLEGIIDHPPDAQVNGIAVKLVDAKGATRAVQTAPL